MKATSARLDLRQGLLTREVRWRSPSGRASLRFERFASLAQPHQLLLRVRLVPAFDGPIELRAALNGHTDNDGLLHWLTVDQGRDAPGAAFLHSRTRQSGIECVTAMRLCCDTGSQSQLDYWDADGTPTLVLRLEGRAGQAVVIDKFAAVYTSRDLPAGELQASRWPQ